MIAAETVKLLGAAMAAAGASARSDGAIEIESRGDACHVRPGQGEADGEIGRGVC